MAKTAKNTKLMSDGLTESQRKFVDLYCGESAGNVTDAYTRAGYSATNADQAAWALIQRPHIQAAIAWKLEQDDGISPEFIEKSVGLLAGPLNSISSFMQCDEAGRFISFNFKTAIECGAMGLIKSIALNDEGQIRKVELYDKLAALTLAARMRGMLIDKTEHSGTIDHRLEAAKENEQMRELLNDPEARSHADALARRMAFKSGGNSEQTN